jgi:DNA-binding SARP family transcriptional activator
MIEHRWGIELLGGLRVVHGGQAVTRFCTRKSAALLAYLAYNNGYSHSRSKLIEVLWPGASVDAGRDRLSVTLYRLRQQLEALAPAALPPFLVDRVEVRLSTERVRSDVTEFGASLAAAKAATSSSERTEALTHAVERYPGHLLPDLQEDWILPERECLAERYFAALQQLTAGLEREGKRGRAIEYARRGVAIDPLREEAHCDLIRLLVAAGRLTAARKQFVELEGLLRRHLRTVPGPATRALLCPPILPAQPARRDASNGKGEPIAARGARKRRLAVRSGPCSTERSDPRDARLVSARH